MRICTVVESDEVIVQANGDMSWKGAVPCSNVAPFASQCCTNGTAVTLEHVQLGYLYYWTLRRDYRPGKLTNKH